MTPEENILLNKLLNILQRDLEEIRSIASLLEKKRAALLNVGGEGIREYTGELVGRMEKLRCLEEERISLSRELARVMGIPENDMRLKAVIQRAPSAIAPLLADLRDELRRWAKSVEDLNRENRKLARNSLEIINGFLKKILKYGEENYLTYGEEGKILREESPVSVFCREF